MKKTLAALVAGLALSLSVGIAAVTALLGCVLGVFYGWAAYTSPGGTALDWADFLPRFGLAVGVVVLTMLQ